MTGFAAPHYLVSADELAGMVGSNGVRVLDVTTRLTSALENTARSKVFDLGHIPGSVFFDVGSAKGAISDPSAELPWMWPDQDRVNESLRAAGVNDGDRIVIVASTPRSGIDSGTMWCTRAWWTLHHMGLDVAILRGGVEAWARAGHPLAADETPVAPGSVAVTSDGIVGRALIPDVLSALEGAACVVDALSADNYNGIDPGYGPRRGHITGAVNMPYLDLISSETAGFVDADEMGRLLSERGLLDGPVVSYCGGAIAATVVAFCCALMGNDDVRVYDGSLMEWTRDSSLPMTDPSAL
ncbi:MAG: rhodanese-like domain-containing protein [Actinomycetota bacterium]|jgi:thiosulfate/3-mercaptopyruvate sulfurtransferase|nr:rhodanese-like domain-containing protein [Actinomycetota bacterium]MDA3016275.1 rhodanese-like domain-containing protein [Actinomycetota bacterium]